MRGGSRSLNSAQSTRFQGPLADRWRDPHIESTWPFIAITRGVGLDFVRKREYGRLRWLKYPAETRDRLRSKIDQIRRNCGPSTVDRRAPRGRVGEGGFRTSSASRAQGPAEARWHQPDPGAQGRRER